MEKQVLENHQRYLERKALYKSFGCDIDKEREFIIAKAQPLYGDILEAGTGKGHFALSLAKQGYRFTTFDISEEEQNFAKLTLRYFGLDNLVDFKIENGEHLSFEDGKFDIVFSVNTLHHLINPYKVIDELIRVLSFEGKIVLSDFSVEGFELMDKIHASEGKIHQVSEVSLADVEKHLITKGFKAEKHKSKFQEVSVVYHQLI
ncbi:MAG: class I SAM-dependent methyltransferase [Candidatus Omnitrophota bacterium]|nr:class I SAM-dependent methyltransferase [Candidatus Omnitrophota bacterium]